MSLGKLFCHHPKSVGESYFQHLRHATLFGLRMVFGGFACILHALLPFICIKTASNIVVKLNDQMVLNRSRLSQKDCPAATGDTASDR